MISRYNIVAVRRQAVLALKKKHTKEALEKACAVLKTDSSAIVRHEAAFVLGSSNDKAAIPCLLDAAKNDRSILVKHEAIEALGDLGIKSSVVESLLKKLSKTRNPLIRDTAQVAIATLRMKK